MVDGDAEERSSIFPGNAAGIQNGTAANAFLTGDLHGLLRKASIDDGKNHFMVIGCHGLSPLLTIITQESVHIHTDHTAQRHSKGNTLAVTDGAELLFKHLHNGIGHILPNHTDEDCLMGI